MAENIPEILCVGFCFLVTSSLGTGVGRVISAFPPEETKSAESELSQMARFLTKGAIVGGLIVTVLVAILAHPIAGSFFSESADHAAVDSAAWLLRAYAVGFVFYLLNSELAVYYKLVEAFPLTHAVFFVEALAFPLVARIMLGELFGKIGFCLGGALGEILTFCLNLLFVGKACGHFPRRIEDYRMEPYLKRLKKAERD